MPFAVFRRLASRVSWKNSPILWKSSHHGEQIDRGSSLSASLLNRLRPVFNPLNPKPLNSETRVWTRGIRALNSARSLGRAVPQRSLRPMIPFSGNLSRFRVWGLQGFKAASAPSCAHISQSSNPLRHQEALHCPGPGLLRACAPPAG